MALVPRKVRKCIQRLQKIGLSFPLGVQILGPSGRVTCPGARNPSREILRKDEFLAWPEEIRRQSLYVEPVVASKPAGPHPKIQIEPVNVGDDTVCSCLGHQKPP